MPRGDGTGPAGKGLEQDREEVDRGKEREWDAGGRPPAGGAVGFCICPNCGQQQPP